MIEVRYFEGHFLSQTELLASVPVDPGTLYGYIFGLVANIARLRSSRLTIVTALTSAQLARS